MAFDRPPQHRVDAPILFVSPSDNAWDFERIEADNKSLPDDQRKLHPWVRYIAGYNRYDLDASEKIGEISASARSYLKGDPWIFRLRRLSFEEWARVDAEFAGAEVAGRGKNDVFRLACQLGVEGVEGPDAPKLEKLGPRLTDSSMQLLHDIGCHAKTDLIFELGRAVYNASHPLNAAEKKA